MKNETSAKTKLAWLEQMWTIRFFDEHVVDSFRKGLFTGSTHPSIAQEATAVGAGAALRPTDPLFTTYRGHGHAIARGLDLNAVMAEILCKETGCCHGRGGSMHLCDVSKEYWGSNAIVAAHIPIAGGMALANKLRKNDKVTAVFFGDGASCEGVFFETLNMAVLWNLALVFVCENNGYAISVPTKKSISVESISQRASGFGLPGVTVDGNDPVAVFDAMGEAVARARSGHGPTLLECTTTRWERHSAISGGKYESAEEAKKWLRVDPIPRFEKELERLGLPREELDLCRARARKAADDALDFAKQSATPKREDAGQFVYA
jgi:acetoin:2,6-dichlorophenolindophenol oxidoreductase subunit alpha